MLACHRSHLELRPGGACHLVGDLLEVDAAHEVHLARVDLEDVHARALAGVGELDLAVDAAGAQERGVEDVYPVGRHQHLDLVGRLKAVQLVEQLQHRALHLAVAATAAALSARGADAVNLIHEDDGRGVLPAARRARGRNKRRTIVKTATNPSPAQGHVQGAGHRQHGEGDVGHSTRRGCTRRCDETRERGGGG